MMLLSIDFENLHQILRSLYQDMMPLCSQMTGVAKGIGRAGRAVLCRVPGMAVPFEGGTRRRVSLAPAVRAGILHHVFSQCRAGHHQQRAVACGQGDEQHLANPDIRHERVP